MRYCAYVKGDLEPGFKFENDIILEKEENTRNETQNYENEKKGTT